MPHAERVFWDWRAQVGWVRFAPGRTASAAQLRDAVRTGTMFTPGDVVYIEKVEDLPDELR